MSLTQTVGSSVSSVCQGPKFCDAGDWHTGGKGRHPEGRNSTQRERMLERWAYTNFRRFNKPSRGNPWYQHKLRWRAALPRRIWTSDGWEVGHEPAMFTCSPESQLCSSLHPKQSGQQGQGGSSDPLLSYSCWIMFSGTLNSHITTPSYVGDTF